MKQLNDPSCATDRWQHLPWTERSPRPHKELMVAVCRQCPAFDACSNVVVAMLDNGDVGVGFLAARSQTERALELSHGRKPDPEVLSDPLASTSNRG